MKTAWLILDHPHQLVYALAVSQVLNNSNIRSNLLISSHPYWKHVRLDRYTDKFDRIIHYKRLSYVGIVQILLQLNSIYRLKYSLRHIGIDKNDLIIGFSCCQFLENTVISMFQDNFKVLITAKSTYLYERTELDDSVYEFTNKGRLSNLIIEPICGIHHTLYMKHHDGDKFDGSLLLRYEKPIEEIYDYILVMDNLDIEPVKELESRITFATYPFCALRDNNMINKSFDKKKIVFFGTPFVVAQNISPYQYATHLNRCLDYLRQIYGETHHLIYRPHPRESKELDLIDLSDFELERNNKLAEFYFLENADAIDAVFSISSTVSRVALNFGLNAYSFCRLFPFDKITLTYFENLMGYVPESFYITDLSMLPQYYIPEDLISSASNQFLKALTDILDDYLNNSN